MIFKQKYQTWEVAVLQLIILFILNLFPVYFLDSFLNKFKMVNYS